MLVRRWKIFVGIISIVVMEVGGSCFGWILKVELRGFVDRLYMWYERKRGIKDVMIFGLKDCKYGVVIYFNKEKLWRY